MRLLTAPLFTAAILATTTSIAHAETMSADVWADNWFAMYANGEPIAEDSVPITTEKSFNAESFTFDAELPVTIGIIAKDFKENDTGLEYIGTRRQQMGDGGLIAQLKVTDGNTVAVTDENLRCLVVHRAPLDTACTDADDPIAGVGACGFTATTPPEGWMNADFDDSEWVNATVHSEADVSPKHGYDKVDWDANARLIWSDDLVQDNTILCRVVIEGTS